MDCGAGCVFITETYDLGTVITVTAAPDEGSTFGGWLDDCAAANPNPVCTLAMTAPHTVTANFARDFLPLAVRKLGSGAGTVTSSDGAIACGLTCTVDYPFGTVVTLTAVADAGSLFQSWNGVCTVTPAGECVVTMDGAKQVDASFGLRSYSLTVAKTGTGSGRVSSSDGKINCGATCQRSYLYKASVTLTATPDANRVFAGWAGACTAAAPAPCIVSIEADTLVTATFGIPGSITGTVVVTGSNPARVEILAERQTGSGWQWAANAMVAVGGGATAADARPDQANANRASYLLGGLPAGVYRISFRDLNNNYRSEYYNAIAWDTPQAARPVTVAIDSTAGQIDATLARPPRQQPRSPAAPAR